MLGYTFMFRVVQKLCLSVQIGNQFLRPLQDLQRHLLVDRRTCLANIMIIAAVACWESPSCWTLTTQKTHSSDVSRRSVHTDMISTEGCTRPIRGRRVCFSAFWLKSDSECLFKSWRVHPFPTINPQANWQPRPEDPKKTPQSCAGAPSSLYPTYIYNQKEHIKWRRADTEKANPWTEQLIKRTPGGDQEEKNQVAGPIPDAHTLPTRST